METLGNKRLQRLKTIWLIPILCWFGAELILRIWPFPPLPTEYEMLLEYQWGKLEHIAGRGILLVGDSSLGNAVAAPIVASKLGMPVVNAALTGSHATYGDYLVVKRAIERGRDWRAIIVFHTPSVWSWKPNRDSAQSLDAAFEVHSLANYSYWLANRSALIGASTSTRRWLVLSMRFGFDRERILQYKARLERVGRRLPELDYIEQNSKIDPQNYVPSNLEEFRPTAYADEWLDALIRLCRAHSVPVFLATGPLPESEVRISRRYLEDMFVWLRAKADQNQGVEVLYTSVPAAPLRFFGDSSSHLNNEAQSAFSRWFAAVLSRGMKGGGEAPASPWWR